MDKIRLLKLIDNIIGKPLLLFTSLFKNTHQLQDIRDILIIRPGGIGDAVLLVPVISQIKEQYPLSNIDVLSEKRNRDVFLLSPMIDKIFHYARPKELLAAITHNYDVAIDTEQWHRLSAVVARLTGAPMVIGFGTNERRKLFTHSVPYSHTDYELDSFLHLFTPIMKQPLRDVTTPFLTVPEKARIGVLPLLKSLSHHERVVLFPGGSIKERRWGSDRFHETAKQLVHNGYDIIIVGGKEDIPDGEVIARGLTGIVNLCGQLTLVETAAVLKEASLLITGDSGIMHVAYGLGVKILALFGPGIEKKWAPRGNNTKTINKELACSPCTRFGYTPSCRKDAQCMKRITIEEVYDAAIELLTR